MVYVAQKYMTGATSGAGTATLTEHLSSPPVFGGVHVTQYLVLCGMFVDRCLSFCSFSFGHCVVCRSIYGFSLPLWYLQTLFITDIFSHGSYRSKLC